MSAMRIVLPAILTFSGRSLPALADRGNCDKWQRRNFRKLRGGAVLSRFRLPAAAGEAPPEDTGEGRDEQNPPGAGGAGPASVRHASAETVAPACREGPACWSCMTRSATYNQDMPSNPPSGRARGTGLRQQPRAPTSRAQSLGDPAPAVGLPGLCSFIEACLAAKEPKVTAEMGAWRPSRLLDWLVADAPHSHAACSQVGDRAEEEDQVASVVVREGAEAGLRSRSHAPGRPGCRPEPGHPATLRLRKPGPSSGRLHPVLRGVGVEF